MVITKREIKCKISVTLIKQSISFLLQLMQLVDGAKPDWQVKCKFQVCQRSIL